MIPVYARSPASKEVRDFSVGAKRCKLRWIASSLIVRVISNPNAPERVTRSYLCLHDEGGLERKSVDMDHKAHCGTSLVKTLIFRPRARHCLPSSLQAGPFVVA